MSQRPGKNWGGIFVVRQAGSFNGVIKWQNDNETVGCGQKWTQGRKLFGGGRRRRPEPGAGV